MQSLVSILRMPRATSQTFSVLRSCAELSAIHKCQKALFSERGRIAAHTESRAIPGHALEDRGIIDRDVSRTRAARGDEVNRIRR